MPSITDSIGRVLGDRYRLVTPLGTGASAHVYLADDVSLRRRVAIKVLHPALSGDQAFLRRFRAEARAAAALNHPNILQVFDWGEENGEPFLVLEYLAGGSLRRVFDTGVPLSPEQAVRIGLEATSGLAYAHRRGLVHRDIKPANLLLDAERRLRIADFGLARALAEAAWTEPAGAILGTARYAAPEQVEGFVLDGKADVYALALVLYEGVTGEAPFIGDTTVSTLMARMNTLLPEHEALGPLNDVLVWAAAPEPSERYDASQLALRLEALAVALPDPAPLPLEGSPPGDEGWWAVGDPGVDTLLGAGATEVGLHDPRGSDRKVPTSVVLPTSSSLPADRPPVEGKPIRRRRRWPWVVAAVVLVATLLAGGAYVVVQSKLLVPSHPIPSLVGKTLPEARSAVRADRFIVHSAGSVPSITVQAGSIVSQRPAPHSGGRVTDAKQGAVIDVVVSSGPPFVPIPDVSSYTTCSDAVQALDEIHLVGICPSSSAQYSSTVPAGGVLGTSPSGSARYGSTVTIVTSKGHAPVAVPAVGGPGSTYATASAALGAAGLVAAKHQAYSSTVPSGQVISTVPSPGSGPVPFGSTVQVDISLGPQPVTVPDLTLNSVASASSALRALGLQVGGPYGPPGASRVLSTEPPAGASVPPGTTVDIYAA
ncbi:MAG: protein kinase domain-containing protein [Acidimicrobiales bacterium]